MTTSDTTAKTPKAKGRFRLPGPTEPEPDDMTSAEQLSEIGRHHHLQENGKTKSIDEALRRSASFVKARQHHTEPPKPKIPCGYCGLMDPTTRRRKQGIMCSSCEEKRRRRRNRKGRRAANLQKIRPDILNRDNNRCQECSTYITGADATLDHIDPDGPESPDNIQLLCRSCNSRRAARLTSRRGYEHIGSRTIGQYAISQQEETENLIISSAILSPYQT